MAKKFAKKVIAIAAVTSMLCAYSISASAATYTSTTAYFNGVDKIQVTTNVFDLSTGDEVTYLAYKGDGAFNPETSEIVYVNQYTTLSTETTAKSFSYVTDSTNVGSSIMMAKAAANFENGAIVAAAEVSDEFIEGVKTTLNVSVDGAEATVVPVETQGTVYQMVNIPLTLTNKEVTAVVVDGTYAATDVIQTQDGLKIGFTVSADAHDIAITTKDAEAEIAAPTFVAGAKDLSGEEITIADETVTPIAKYSVIADASNTPLSYVVGVAFADSAVFTKGATGAAIAGAEYYDSIGNARGSDGKYAIIIVDDSEELASTTVYYATYMKDAEGNYTYGSTGSIDLAPQA